MKRPLWHWLSSLALPLLLVTSVHAQTPIAPFKAEYDLYYDDDNVGESVLQLSALANGEWQFETRSEASLYLMSFSDHEQSRFVWHNERPKPLAFSKERQRPGKTERVQQQFDWQTQTDRGTRGKKSWSTALLGDTQDLQSHLLALQLDLRAGKRELHYAVSKHGRVRDYRYKVTKEETLGTALGKLATIRVERIRDADDDRQTISWLAPSLDFIPVRIQQFEQGKLQGDMRIRKLTR
ncbi:MAG: DUF3108 domain-containing protein [Pseudomonadota bacterium]